MPYFPKNGQKNKTTENVFDNRELAYISKALIPVIGVRGRGQPLGHFDLPVRGGRSESGHCHQGGREGEDG